MFSCSNYNANNIKSVILAPFSLALFLKIYFILKFLIRGVLLSKLIWWLIFLIPSVRFLVSKRLAYYFRLVAVIFLLGKIMPTYLQYIEKGLVYITIIALSNCQPFFYIKYTKLNICSFCNIYLVFNAKYIFLTRFYIL